jgi:hypothetical protein
VNTTIEIARKSDDADLLEFYRQFTVRGLVELRPTRPEGFFAAYETSSDEYETYVLRGPQGEIQGLSSFIYRPVLLNGEIKKVAFATDLRIQPQRGPLREWSQNFLPAIRSVYERKKVAAIFSAMNRSDPMLQNIFLKPRSPKRAWPRYHLYRRFDVVTLHGRFPWSKPPLKTLRFEQGNTGNRARLIRYLCERAIYHPFASMWDEKSFMERLERLRGLRLEDFWLAFDNDDQMVGCMGSWSSLASQEFRPISYSLVAHNFRQFLKFGRFLGWSRPLTKPVRSTGVESPLKFRYLVYPYATNQDVFDSLLSMTFDHVPHDEFLVYAHSEQDFRRKPPPWWIANSMPYSLYNLLPPEMAVPQFLDPREVLNPEIEAYFYL